jgi:hypothetical protein
MAKGQAKAKKRGKYKDKGKDSTSNTPKPLHPYPAPIPLHACAARMHCTHKPLIPRFEKFEFNAKFEKRRPGEPNDGLTLGTGETIGTGGRMTGGAMESTGTTKQQQWLLTHPPPQSKIKTKKKGNRPKNCKNRDRPKNCKNRDRPKNCKGISPIIEFLV